MGEWQPVVESRIAMTLSQSRWQAFGLGNSIRRETALYRVKFDKMKFVFRKDVLVIQSGIKEGNWDSWFCKILVKKWAPKQQTSEEDARKRGWLYWKFLAWCKHTNKPYPRAFSLVCCFHTDMSTMIQSGRKVYIVLTLNRYKKESLFIAAFYFLTKAVWATYTGTWFSWTIHAPRLVCIGRGIRSRRLSKLKANALRMKLASAQRQTKCYPIKWMRDAKDS